MEKAALFCDETAEYRCPEEPDPGDLVTLRFRTAKNNADHMENERIHYAPYGENQRQSSWYYGL